MGGSGKSKGKGTKGSKGIFIEFGLLALLQLASYSKLPCAKARATRAKGLEVEADKAACGRLSQTCTLRFSVGRGYRNHNGYSYNGWSGASGSGSWWSSSRRSANVDDSRRFVQKLSHAKGTAAAVIEACSHLFWEACSHVI